MSTVHSKDAWQLVFTGAIEQHQEHLLPEVIGLFALFKDQMKAGIDDRLLGFSSIATAPHTSCSCRLNSSPGWPSW